jgi:hypothetical protein
MPPVGIDRCCATQASGFEPWGKRLAGSCLAARGSGHQGVAGSQRAGVRRDRPSDGDTLLRAGRLPLELVSASRRIPNT